MRRPDRDRASDGIGMMHSFFLLENPSAWLAGGFSGSEAEYDRVCHFGPGLGLFNSNS